MINNWTTKDLLVLSNIKGLTEQQRIVIATNYANLEHLLEASLPPNIQVKLSQTGLFGNNNNSRDFAEKQTDFCHQYNTRIVSFFDDDYPPLLKEIFEPPLLLFVKGTLANKNKPAISIVGTRQNTTYGKIITENFATIFARNNITIVSGMAAGIDSIAHITAIKQGGSTYAIIASGLDKIAPQYAIEKAEQILDANGAIMTFFPFETAPLPPFFLLRNRVIAGISLATLVTECDYKSGALNTARHAASENRQVYAIPGNVTSNKSRGTNKLIREGNAKIALSPDEILTDLGFTTETSTQERLILLKDDKEKLIYSQLSFEPVHIDSLIDLTGFDISELLVKLLEMEFSGIIRQMPGKYYIKSI